MGQKLKFNHRLRIDLLRKRQRFDKLDAYLGTLAAKGFDVAAVPFLVLDKVLTEGSQIDSAALGPLARHTLGGQPRLFAAVLTDISGAAQPALRQIVEDGMTHPMTRFEAMGWATYLAHRATTPSHGSPAGDLFQFWDQPVPPSEIVDAMRLWRRAATSHKWYDDAAASAYICEGFGADAARGYANLWHPALKSDVFRLYRLARDGGVYCDADSKPEHRAPDFLKRAGTRVWASSMTAMPNCAAINGFIAAPAQHPMIEGLLAEVLRNIADPQGRGIFWLSGPGALTGFLYRNAGRFDVGLLSQGCLKSDIFRQFDAAYKQTDQNWRVYEHNRDQGNDAGLRQILKVPS